MLTFKIDKTSEKTRARAGTIKTMHGEIQTPIFMPVGTQGSVKAVSVEELDDCGAQIILGNTYHLYLRPTSEVIDVFGGLHRFMNWDKPILTDSGGFQFFSLAQLSKYTEEAVIFQSHIDGSRHTFRPEDAISMQVHLNSDIMMCLDYCIKYPANEKETEKAMKLTTLWAARCKKAWEEETSCENSLFGIVQGGMYKNLRQQSARELADLDFPGYSIGGLSVGEPKDIMMEMADYTLPLLPREKPKYIMGVGTPEDLVELVDLGADMFDCVMPSRNARNGQMFTKHGKLNIGNLKFRLDEKPVEEGCTCYTCRNYSRSYLRHLYKSGELLAYRLNTIHNIHYYMTLVKKMRHAILNDSFKEFKQEFYTLRNI